MRDRTQRLALCLLLGTLLGAMPAFAVQSWRGKNVYFGDAHWHSCLSQDADRETSLDAQYESMLFDNRLDFSLQSDHAEAATAGILRCEPYLPLNVNGWSGEEIASAMKAAADAWYGVQFGAINFVTFPGYEWAPDARCWQLLNGAIVPNDLNGEDNTPGHINYFFDRTTGWTYHDDVWEPGDGDSDLCAALTAVGLAYYSGSKDWVDEILGQLIHQRDDPNRDYDLMIQYNHPAASIDKGGSSDHLAKWFDFEHSSSLCSVAEGGTPCAQSQCEAVRRAYGLTSVEWYTRHEASLGSTEHHEGTGTPCEDEVDANAFPLGCYHDSVHVADRFVSSRALREGYQLGFTGGSDSHGGRKFAPTGFPGGRGAGSGSLTVVYAAEPTREAIWEGLTRRRTYALSRFREIGPVHKGRVDLYSLDPLQFNTPRIERGMGEIVETLPAGRTRSFTVSAAAEEGTTGVVPVELRLYRVGPNTPLTQLTTPAFYWLDDIAGDPGKLGELVGYHLNTTGEPELVQTFDVVVYPGDAIFAVVPYSDYTWIDDFYDTNQQPLDADEDGVVDEGKTGFPHADNNTWARTTPIFFHARDEQATATSTCANVTLSGSGSVSPQGVGGNDAGIAGDDSVLPVAIPGGYRVEWNRHRFTLPRDYQYVSLSFYTGSDDDDTGTLFGVRIDGRLVYSGRGGIDHANDTLVEKVDIPFPLGRGLHQLEIHSDDQEFAHGDNDPDFHCTDHNGVPAFVDGLAFHTEPGTPCSDHTPPEITCPAGISVECSAFGGVPASDAAIVAFLGGANATDDLDPAPEITTNAPTFFPNGNTTVTFTAEDDAGNTASCSANVVVSDTTPPQLAPFVLSPSQLRPPKHKMVAITVPTLVATDVCDAAPAIRCSVTSDEVPNGQGDGNTPSDIIFNGTSFTTQGTGEQTLVTSAGQGTFTLQLRAERSGKGDGRTYTAACAGVDASANRSTARTATVVVPK